MKKIASHYELIYLFLSLFLLITSTAFSDPNDQADKSSTKSEPIQSFQNKLSINSNNAKNSTLSHNGSISGTAYNAQTGESISLLNVTLNDANFRTYANSRTNNSGEYQFSDLPAGTYYLMSNGYILYQGSTYLLEYYDNADENSVTPIIVGNPYDRTGIDLSMDMGGTISGYVYQSDGITPISNIMVYVRPNNTFVRTNSSGYYAHGGLLTGDYYVYTPGNETFNGEFYDNVSIEAEATLVSVTAPNTVSNINFLLEEEKGYISGTIYDATSLDPVQDKTIEIKGTINTYVVTTNSDGIYISPPLNVGEYKIYSPSEFDYQFEYYENVYTINSATSVYVDPPNTVTVDMTIFNPVVSSISGTAYDAQTGEPISQLQVRLVESISDDISVTYTNQLGE